jgi:hypothetical protein
LRCCE